MPAFAPPLHLHAQDRRWYVVRTKTRKEDYAVQQLERRGVAVFLPRILEYGRDDIAPLFPGYLFVHIGPTPTPVQDSVIRFITASAGEGGVIRLLSPFKQGDRVQITGGPLAG